MTLFEHQQIQYLSKNAPLATKLRPTQIRDFVGQDHLLGENCVLSKIISSNRLPSMLFWGPPGSGKTTLVTLIAQSADYLIHTISAVDSGTKDVREIIKKSRDAITTANKQSILFIDEIHRFNKAQQDILLPYVEDGSITLIGATTENPSFEIITPLLSRMHLFLLHPLNKKDIEIILQRAVTDEERGLGKSKLTLDDEAQSVIIDAADGDARVALNTLELAAQIALTSPQSNRVITKTTISESLQHATRYDKTGDEHYNTISAFIKSVRASDPNAAIYWLSRMLKAGEDPLFIARRLVILASEDIGLADPYALSVAVAAQQATHFLGMPESRIPLAEATIYLATSNKSNSAYQAINTAIRDTSKEPDYPVPLHLRNAPSKLMKELGYGKDYMYSHDFPEHFSGQTNLPEQLKGRTYYEPTQQGHEKIISERLREWWNLKGKIPRDKSP
ncbi:MAG: AAA family ATPase [Dehalococcoidia bacterium]|nr:AAA family ATPase [Dehalococcoidia bacterium]